MNSINRLLNVSSQEGRLAAAELLMMRVGSKIFGDSRFYHGVARMTDFLFDVRYKTDTGGVIQLAEMGINAEVGRHYIGVPPRAFRLMMRHLQIRAEQFTFIDLGCGKGRAILLAARLGFKKLIGVDIAPEMLSIAAKNLKRYHSSCDLVCVDAAEYQFPPDPTVVFLFNPFYEPVMNRVAKNLQSSLERDPRELYVVHWRPAINKPFDEASVLKLIHSCYERYPWYAIYCSVAAVTGKAAISEVAAG